MTKPGEMVENLGKNCKTAMARKKMFAIRRNCSNRFRGKKVMIVYFEVTFWFVGAYVSLSTLPFLSNMSSGNGVLT